MFATNSMRVKKRDREKRRPKRKKRGTQRDDWKSLRTIVLPNYLYHIRTKSEPNNSIIKKRKKQQNTQKRRIHEEHKVDKKQQRSLRLTF
jgi:hypothetical protein